MDAMSDDGIVLVLTAPWHVLIVTACKLQSFSDNHSAWRFAGTFFFQPHQ